MAGPQLNYGNWVRKRIVLVLGSATLAVGALQLVPAGVVYHVVVTIVFALLLLTFLLPLYAYFMFSENGGRFQAKLYDCIVQRLGTDRTGKYLDIGSGNGVLTVSLALLGLAEVQFTPLHEVLPVPVLLRHPKIFGKVAILSGRK